MSETLAPLLYGTYVRTKRESIKPLPYATYWSPYPQAVGMRFDGTAYVTLPALLGGRNAFTVEMVLSTTDTRGGDNWDSPHFFGFQTRGENSRDFGIGVSGGQAFIQEGLGIANDNIKGAYIADGAVHRIVAVCDGENALATLYVDGVESLSYAIGTSTVANHAIYVGSGSLNSLMTSMILYDLRVWGKALSASEIGAAIDGTEEGLLAWYACNEPSFVLADSSGHGNDGTITGRLITIWGARDASVEIMADTSRTPGIGARLLPDAVRQVRRSTALAADASRRLANRLGLAADAMRSTGKRTAQFDTERIANASFRFDALRAVSNPRYQPVGERFDGSNYVELPPFIATREDYTVEATGSSGMGLLLGTLSDLMKLFLTMMGNAEGGDYVVKLNFPGGSGDMYEAHVNGVTYRFHDRVIDQRIEAGETFNLAAALTCTGDASGFLDMFLNGLPMGSLDIVLLEDETPPNTVPFTIGKGADPEHVIDVYRLIVWNSARTADEVASDAMGSGFDADELKDILAMYDFSGMDPTNVTLVIDTRGGHNGTVRGDGEVKTVYGMAEPFVPREITIAPDTLRRVVLQRYVNGDTLRQTGKRTLAFDACRNVCKALAIPFDARRDVPHIINVDAEAPQEPEQAAPRSRVEVSGGKIRYAIGGATVKISQTGDMATTEGGIATASVGQAVLSDGTRVQLSEGRISVTYADGTVETSRGIPWTAGYAGEVEVSRGTPWREPKTSCSYPAGVDLSNGLKSVTLAIAEGQLWDSLQVVVANGSIGINERVCGRVLDYGYSMLCESLSIDGIMESVQLMTSIDETLYRCIKYSAGNEKRKQAKLESIMTHAVEDGKVVEKDSGFKRIVYEEVNTGRGFLKASEHASKIAAAMGLSLVARFDDFTPNLAVDEDGNIVSTTYQGLIQSIFGWSSQVPHRYIHACIRGNALHIIQRGKETGTVDLSGCDCTMPKISRRLLRTAWSDDNDKTNQTENPEYPERPRWEPPEWNPDDPDSADNGGELTMPQMPTIPNQADYQELVDKKYIFHWWEWVGGDEQDYPETSTRECGKKRVESTYEYKETQARKDLLKETQVITDEDGNQKTIEVVHGESDQVGWGTLGAREVDGNEEECLGSMSVRKHSSDTVTQYEKRRHLVERTLETLSLSGEKVAIIDHEAFHEALEEYRKAMVEYQREMADYFNSRMMEGLHLTPYQQALHEASEAVRDAETPEERTRAWEAYREAVAEANEHLGEAMQSNEYASLMQEAHERYREEMRRYNAAVQSTLLQQEVNQINSSLLYTGSDKVFDQMLQLELKMLNRKTEETVSVSVYGLSHIIDYDDKVIFNGCTYFLQSNTFTRDAVTVNRQDLRLIRWI